MIKCNDCGKEFKYNYLLKHHQNRKKPCITNEVLYDNNINKLKNIEEEINILSNKIKIKTDKSLKEINTCMFCNNIQSNKANMIRHLNKYCSIKKKMSENIDKLNQDKKDINIIINQYEIKIKDEKIKKLELALNSKLNSKLTTHNITINNINNINNINPTINNTINTQNNLVVINPFGKEDLSHITIDDYKKYLNGFFPGFIKFIEKVHFDDNAPQNKNISITNLRSKYLSVHDGDQWLTQDKNEVINNLLIKKHNILSEICEELEETDKIDKTTIDNFEEFCQNYNDADAKKNTRENVIMMIYDKINGDKDIKPKKKLKK
jgi:hypothetical protein